MSHDMTDARQRSYLKPVLLILLLLVVGGLYAAFRDQFNLDRLAAQEETLRGYQREHPILAIVAAFTIYALVTGLSLPGASAMTLVLGWYFGFWRGLVIVSFASTTGATIAFLLSRYLLRDAIQSRFGERLAKFNEALDREGAFYLFTLRLIPAVPFFVINVVMGLTRIRVVTYWWVSQLGMLAGTCVYVYAGTTIPTLAQIADPAQLRTTDVLDWPGLIHELNEAADGDREDLWRQIWEQLPETTATRVRELARSGETASDDDRIAIVTGLNHVLREPDLVEESRSELDSDKSVTEFNRQQLVAAYPEIIGPPRSILSVNLLIAFALLGLFPLVVRWMMKRVRPGRGIDKEHPPDSQHA